MGAANWSQTDWKAHATRSAGQSQQQIFKSQSLKDSLNPALFKFREARDSVQNPESTPIIIASDVTGSMGIIAETIIKDSMGKIMTSLYDHKPVTDPSICCMAIGDMYSDQAPVQATQFESDIRLAEQMCDFWIERNGGGNGGESYASAWLFALAKVKADIHKKRHKKGYIFTIGDEACHPLLTKDQIKRFLDLDAEADMHVDLLLKDVMKNYEVFHLITENSTTVAQNAVQSWRDLLGERAIVLPNLDHLAEGITATIDIVNGHSTTDVKKRYSHAITVIDAVSKSLVTT